VLNRGDAFLVEGFAYSHLLEGVSEPHGYNPLPVPIDGDGIVPEGLRQVDLDPSCVYTNNLLVEGASVKVRTSSAAWPVNCAWAGQLPLNHRTYIHGARCWRRGGDRIRRHSRVCCSQCP
jgi:hypothetical protein